MEAAALKAASLSGLVWSGTGNWTHGISGFDSPLPLKSTQQHWGPCMWREWARSKRPLAKQDVGSVRLELRHCPPAWGPGKNVCDERCSQILCPCFQGPLEAQAARSYPAPQQRVCAVVKWNPKLVSLQPTWGAAHSYLYPPITVWHHDVTQTWTGIQAKASSLTPLVCFLPGYNVICLKSFVLICFFYLIKSDDTGQACSTVPAAFYKLHHR